MHDTMQSLFLTPEDTNKKQKLSECDSNASTLNASVVQLGNCYFSSFKVKTKRSKVTLLVKLKFLI
jgi:hypothetical protein